MRANTLSSWALALAGIAALAGAALIWLSTVAARGALSSAAVVTGIGLCGLAAVFMVLAAVARARRDAAGRRLARYACDRCGYTPRPEDLEAGESFPCPACGRPLYPND